MGPEEQRRLITKLMYEHHKRWKVAEESKLLDLGSQVLTEVSAEGANNNLPPPDIFMLAETKT